MAGGRDDEGGEIWSRSDNRVTQGLCSLVRVRIRLILDFLLYSCIPIWSIEKLYLVCVYYYKIDVLMSVNIPSMVKRIAIRLWDRERNVYYSFCRRILDTRS